MTTRQMKPRKLPEDDCWSVTRTTASLMAWGSDWVERQTKLAIRQGGKCFCGYTPEKKTEHIKRPRLRQLMKRELLHRHMKDHVKHEGYQKLKYQSGFSDRGQIKPKVGKP